MMNFQYTSVSPVQPQAVNVDLSLYELAKQTPGNTIKALLTLKNISQRDIARKHNVWPTDLSKVIQGKRKTRWIQEVVADELGIPSGVLFQD